MKNKHDTTVLSDDMVWRGVIITMTHLREVPADSPEYAAYKSAALSWIKEAKKRLK